MKPAVLVIAAVLFAIGFMFGYDSKEPNSDKRIFAAIKVGGLLMVVGITIGAISGSIS